MKEVWNRLLTVPWGVIGIVYKTSHFALNYMLILRVLKRVILGENNAVIWIILFAPFHLAHPNAGTAPWLQRYTLPSFPLIFIAAAESYGHVGVKYSHRAKINGCGSISPTSTLIFISPLAKNLSSAPLSRNFPNLFPLRCVLVSHTDACAVCALT